jgi:hypothetical protein
VSEALADRSQVSLISCTGNWSMRVFQMLFAGKTRQSVPGTSAASAVAMRPGNDTTATTRLESFLTLNHRQDRASA